MSKPIRVNWTIAVWCAAFLTLLFGVQQWIVPPLNRPDLDLVTSLSLQAIQWGLWLPMLPLILRLTLRYPLQELPRFGWIVRSILAGSAFAVVHSALAGIVRWFTGLAVSATFESMLVNSVFTSFGTDILRFAAILLACQAVVYLNAVRDRERDAARFELDLALAKLATVESRLQPHFLFNTLNAISALVREDQRGAERMIGQLSDLLRASLTSDPSQEVRLEDELVLTQQYLDIERVRFQDRLRVTIDAAPDVRRAMVPHLMLQPLVENAVRHGIAPLERGGTIEVQAVRSDGLLRVTVVDDGIGLGNSPRTDGTGIGLGGLRTRLSHMYRGLERVDIRGRDPSGTVVTVQIPFRAGPA